LSGAPAAPGGRLEAWKTYGLWSIPVTLAFFAVYPFCNWVTSLRTVTYGLYVPWELSLPFVPGFVWVYLSMYVLFVLPGFLLAPRELVPLAKRLVAGTLASGVVFLLVPSHLGFPREVPPDPVQAAIYARIFSLDLPHNMAPSLHVVWSALFLAALARASSMAARGFFWTWLVLIAASTVFVHQHHLVDVVSGLGLAAVLHKRTFRER
jgi:membrane-associated phospholipid phosphatase